MAITLIGILCAWWVLPVVVTAATTTWAQVKYCMDQAEFCMPAAPYAPGPGPSYWDPLPPPDPPCDVTEWNAQECFRIIYGGLRINFDCPTNTPTSSATLSPPPSTSVGTAAPTGIPSAVETSFVTYAQTVGYTQQESSDPTAFPSDPYTLPP